MKTRAIPLLFALLLFAVPAEAKHRGFRYFPQDLDMEAPGTGELSLRSGFTRHGAPALAAPDLEIDLGLLRRLELGVDGQWGVNNAGDDWAATDQMWLSFKHLLYDERLGSTAFALGVQHGPRVAATPTSKGLGYEALAMVGVRREAWQALVSLGCGLDPHDTALGLRPWVVMGSVDLDWSLSDTWSLEAQLLDAQGPGAPGWVESAGVAWQTGSRQLRMGGTTGYAGSQWAPGLYVGFSQKLDLR